MLKNIFSGLSSFALERYLSGAHSKGVSELNIAYDTKLCWGCDNGHNIRLYLKDPEERITRYVLKKISVPPDEPITTDANAIFCALKELDGTFSEFQKKYGIKIEKDESLNNLLAKWR